MKDQINKNKIFVTGVFASGKTTFSKTYSKKFNIPFLNFDHTFNYDKCTDSNYVKRYYDKLPNKFVIDAVPFNKGWNIFSEYINKNKSQIALVYVVCSNPIVWLFRVINFKALHGMIKELKTTGKILESCFRQYATLYYDTFPSIEKVIEYKIFDSYTNEYIDKEELFKRISWVLAIYKEKIK